MLAPSVRQALNYPVHVGPGSSSLASPLCQGITSHGWLSDVNVAVRPCSEAHGYLEQLCGQAYAEAAHSRAQRMLGQLLRLRLQDAALFRLIARSNLLAIQVRLASGA